ncbi:MAG TPA: TIM barrel protein [Tepidisphaeraceae bacterium]|nr:TIM barrel protein [Tepidisphaeraceae bacterium]
MVSLTLERRSDSLYIVLPIPVVAGDGFGFGEGETMSSQQWSVKKDFKFSAGPWNIHTGADPFGPTVRPERSFIEKLKAFKDLGFDYVQFHDDDAVPDDYSAADREKKAAEIRKLLDDHGLKAEICAPRHWEDAHGIDGPVTSNNAADRKWAIERGKRTCDVARILGTDRFVWWPAREGTYIRESKDAVTSFNRMLDFLNAILDYDKKIKVMGEMKPNEPMDLMYLPTTGHFLALAYKSIDPTRVGVLIESAHAILAGLDPSDEFAYAMFHNKLWGVHLNDQNGLKYDQDKTFGSVDLRRAFNQADVLVRNGYGRAGEVIGLDVKAMRTQPADKAFAHLKHSKEIFLDLVDLVHSIDRTAWQGYVDARDYEGLERFMIQNLMGKKV